MSMTTTTKSCGLKWELIILKRRTFKSNFAVIGTIDWMQTRIQCKSPNFMTPGHCCLSSYQKCSFITCWKWCIIKKISLNCLCNVVLQLVSMRCALVLCCWNWTFHRHFKVDAPHALLIVKYRLTAWKYAYWISKLSELISHLTHGALLCYYGWNIHFLIDSGICFHFQWSISTTKGQFSLHQIIGAFIVSNVFSMRTEKSVMEMMVIYWLNVI